MKKKVILGMSGGVDSSVVAMKLKKERYEVIGLTFMFSDLDSNNKWVINEAKKLAEKLQISHFVVDLRNEFNELIISYFTSEYKRGKTPFPCAKCNPEIKFKNLVKYAEKYNCDYIATGHYARITDYKGNRYINRGIDTEKDQSFFLWGLNQELLKKLILPLGDLSKTVTREYSNQMGFPFLAKKKDSLGICFIEGNDYRSFLKLKGIKSEPGNYVNKKGEIIGQHTGIINYTVGQRRGLGLNTNIPFFVSDINATKNEIILTEYKDLYKRKIRIERIKFVNIQEVTITKIFTVKIRYRLQNTPCRIELSNNERAIVHLEEPLAMVAAGQTAVFYDGDRVVGGGFIESSE